MVAEFSLTGKTHYVLTYFRCIIFRSLTVQGSKGGRLSLIMQKSDKRKYNGPLDNERTGHTNTPILENKQDNL